MNDKTHISSPRPAWQRATACTAVIALLSTLATLTVLATQADRGPFDSSSIVATPAEAGVGDQVGFAIYLVNSGTMTATGVLVWNPLPPGSTYVSASGGAFPVVGNPEPNTFLPQGVSEGLAYDVGQKRTVPLGSVAPRSVGGIAWVGDVPPGGMAVPGLVVRVDNPAGRDLTDTATVYHERQPVLHVSGSAWIRPYRTYCPVTLRNWQAPDPTPPATATPAPTSFVTITLAPAEAGVVAATGQTREDALAAARGVGGWPNDGELFLHSQHGRWVDSQTGEITEFWSFARQYFRFELPPASTSFELHLPVYLSLLEPPTGTLQLTVHAGTWTGPITPVLEVWTGWQPAALGQISFTLPLTFSPPYTLVLPLSVPLDLLSPPTTTLRLVVRSGCEDHPEICSPETGWFMHALGGFDPVLRVRVPGEQ